MNRAVNPIQLTNTNSFASQDVKAMALAVQESMQGLPVEARERQRYIHMARNRGDTKAVNQLASNLALSQNPEPKQIKPLIRHRNAREIVEQ